jgi:peptide/nickel transport system substrate-binding protein
MDILKRFGVYGFVALIFILFAFPIAGTFAQEDVFETYGPRIDEIIIKIYFEPEPEYLALAKGEIDVIDWPLSAEKVEEFKVDPNIVLESYAEFGMFEFDLNNRRWPMSEVDFRRALAHLVDKDKIVTEIVKGYGVALPSPVPPIYGEFSNPYVKVYEYDPEEAKRLLDEAGFTVGPDGWRIDPQTGETLAPIVIYGRADDPYRAEAARLLATELEAIGIPVELNIVERGVCFEKVMGEYDYHVYTGGWLLTRDPDHLYDLYHSDMDVYPDPWSLNYPGFRNDTYDEWAYKLKYNCTTREEFKEAVWKAQEILADQVGIIPLWSTVGVKAYRKGWLGVVNEVGFGVNSWWTFLNAYKEGAPYGGTISYGFKSDIENLNPIMAEWYWDWEVLEKIFDSLIAVDPYDPSVDLPWLGDWTLESWEEGVKITFNLREDATWQDGEAFTSADVKFTVEVLQRTRAPLFFSAVQFIEKVETPDTHTAVVYYNVTSFLALHWIGGIPMLPKHIWETYEDPTIARPWEDAHPTVPGMTKLIGTGPFIFKEYRIGEYVRLTRNPNYFNRIETIFPPQITALEEEAAALKAAPTMEAVDALAAKVESLASEVITLRDLRPALETEALVGRVEALRTAVAELRAAVLAQELSLLASVVEGLSSDVESLMANVGTLSSEVDELTSELEAAEGEIATLRFTALGIGAVAVILAVVAIGLARKKS